MYHLLHFLLNSSEFGAGGPLLLHNTGFCAHNSRIKMTLTPMTYGVKLKSDLLSLLK